MAGLEPVESGVPMEFQGTASPGEGSVSSPKAKARRRTSVAGYGLETQIDSVTGEEREQWGSRSEFIFCLMGYAIGIGNLWRFPYLVGMYGGGAFLVPYLLSLVVIAAPLYLMELSIGQKTRCGAVEAYKQMAPMWHGMGYTSLLAVVIISAYYNILLAYATVYLVNSFQHPLPWVAPIDGTGVEVNGTWVNQTLMTPERFWSEKVLNEAGGKLVNGTWKVVGGGDAIYADGAGDMCWPVAGALLFIWVLIYVCLARGIKGSGKVAYVTVSMPVLLLVVMFFRAVTLKNAGEGILFYLKPDLSKLGDLNVWSIACSQILFSLSPGMGTAIALASFNKRDENIYFDNMFIAACNSSFSLFGGFVIFGVVGYMSDVEGKPIEEIAASGPGLAFIVFAQALATMGEGWGQFFAVLFYIMLLTLGLDSSFAWVETINTAINDALRQRGKEVRKELICLGTCVFLFLGGLIFCTRAGNKWLDIIDHYCATYILLGVGLLEAIMVSWVYGADRLAQDIKDMIGKDIPRYWTICWKWIIPAVVYHLILILFVKETETAYGGYPTSALVVGWLSFILPMLMIPLFAFVEWRSQRLSADAVLDGKPKLFQSESKKPTLTTGENVKQAGEDPML